MTTGAITVSLAQHQSNPVTTNRVNSSSNFLILHANLMQQKSLINYFLGVATDSYKNSVGV